jgi:hypothetical protein
MILAGILDHDFRVYPLLRYGFGEEGADTHEQSSIKFVTKP